MTSHSNSIKDAQKPIARNRFVWGGALLALIIAGVIISLNWEYYGLERTRRPEHDLHSWLRPSGRLGLPLGIIAAILFVMNLGYLIRKRLVRMRFLGSLRMWMEIHVLTGISGGILVLFHSALAASSALGTLALFSMVVTIGTGLVGRIIYVQVPRSREGRELEFNQVKKGLAEHREALEQSGIDAPWFNENSHHSREGHGGLLQLFHSFVMGSIRCRHEYRFLKQQILGSELLRPCAPELLPLAKAYSMYDLWFRRYHDLRGLIATWRFFHRWMAVLMLCVVACHIFVAIWFGALGIGGSE